MANWIEDNLFALKNQIHCILFFANCNVFLNKFGDHLHLKRMNLSRQLGRKRSSTQIEANFLNHVDKYM